MEFRLGWRSDDATHAERLFLRRVDFWRDILPGGLEGAVNDLAPGDTAERAFGPGELVPGRDQGLVRTIRRSDFRRQLGMQRVAPRTGRFYPRTLISGLSDAFSGDFTPFRVIGMDADRITVDLNHPLAGDALNLSASLLEELPPRDQRGGACHDIARVVTEKGPGLEALRADLGADFFGDYPFTRLDDNPDTVFYRMPRLVEHVDAVATREISGIYRRLLTPGTRVLDLMSSWVSHLPEELGLEVAGLGLNEQELQKNPRLGERVLHDLNMTPELPYPDARFDAVVCANSVEYLVRPLEVFAEIARVLKPGGVAAIVFSERWFPPKVITLWTELHPFERLGLVLEGLRRTGRFDGLNSESIRGYPRPDDDKYRGMMPYADPVYAAWGRRSD
jgi:SAM-dependent methyltransferase